MKEILISPLIQKARFLPLITVLVLVSIVVTFVSVGAVYQFSLNTEKTRLTEMVKSQTRFIESVARFDQEFSQNAHPDGAKAATLSQILDVLGRHNGFGKTGEFVLGRRDGDNIVFLTLPRHLDHKIPPTPIMAKAAEPMRRALMGQSGVLTGIDYRSKTVIAAHELISGLDVGLVAKIDLEEFRAPFVRASLIACLVAIFSIFLAALLLRQIEHQASRKRASDEHLDDVLIISNQEHFLYFILIMITVALVITVSSVSVLYSSSYVSAKTYLSEMAKTQAELMGAVARFDVINRKRNDPDGARGASLTQILGALEPQTGFGDTGEFVLGEREKDYITFLTKSRYSGQAIKSIHMTLPSAKPMQQALMGKTGVLVGLDYRSITVLAAYEAVPQMDLGLVVKIDQSEIRAPFIQASLLSFGSAFVVILFGALYLVQWGGFGHVQQKADEGVQSLQRQEAAHVSVVLILFVIGLSLAILGLDVVTPLGIAGGVPYVVVVLVGWWFPARRHIIALAIISSLLTGMGFALAPNGGDLAFVLINRAYAIIIIWITALIMSLGKASELARKRQAEELAKLTLAVEHSPSSVIMTDVQGVIEYVNSKFSEVTGYAANEVIGGTMRILKSGQMPNDVYHELWATISKGKEWRGEILNKKKNGDVYWEAIGILPILSSKGKIMHYVALQEDISERKQAQEQLLHMANHDTLTGLPTRRLALERILSALAMARRDQNKTAVLFIDLDGFKAVNDTLGHEAGDQLLKDVADRLSSCVREVDTVARIGGDEFLAVLVDVDTTEHVSQVALKLIKALSKTFVLCDEKAKIGASIGIALYPDHGDAPETLLKCADIAMYKVKKDGKNNFSFADD